MEKMRIAIAKKAATQYVGHLDFGRALERALRRAKLPVAFSEGFNPHMKISFGPALSVGVASNAEYVDVELQEHVDATDFGERLARQLPPGLAFVDARPVASPASLAAALNIADYQVELIAEKTPELIVQAQGALDSFLAAEQVMYTRHTPKGVKNIEVKQFLVEGPNLMRDEAKLKVCFRLRMKSTGAVKPQEVFSVLSEQYAFPSGASCFIRTGLWCDTGAAMNTAFDI